MWESYLKNFDLYGAEYVIENIVEPESIYQGIILCQVKESLFPRKESYKLIITSEQVS